MFPLLFLLSPFASRLAAACPRLLPRHTNTRQAWRRAVRVKAGAISWCWPTPIIVALWPAILWRHQRLLTPSRTAARSHWGEALGFVDVAVNQEAHGAPALICELLSITRVPHRTVLHQRISYMLNLSVGQVVQSEPLHVEEAPKPIEGVDGSRSRMPRDAAHSCVSLEAIAALVREDQDDTR